MPDASHPAPPTNGHQPPAETAAVRAEPVPAIEAVLTAVPGGDGQATTLPPALPSAPDDEHVLQRLPTPFHLETKGRDALPETSTMLRTPKAKVNRLWVLWRLLSMIVLGSFLVLAKWTDLLFIRDQEKRERRGGARLRRVFEVLGGALVKVGQQLSLRLDILPAAYCDALAKLLDESDREVPFEYARERIEAAAGKPLGEIFRAFDPAPIGSATIACVYQAYLINGDRVAVKVRRPGIVKLFNTDLTVLDWVLTFVETLTIIRPGVSLTFRDEMRKLLLEELDFRTEARYQELFRRYFKKYKKLHITAPKIHFGLSSEDVMVSEFVEGIWVKDLIAAINTKDEKSLAYVRELGIRPKRIAKQLVLASHYSLFECPFFHGDPHPGNIVVRPNNEIVLVDFGACGVFTEKERNLMRQLHYFKSLDDIGGMVQSVIALMEPIPPIDMESFERDLQNEWWHAFYGILSKHAAWWERTSFRLWLALMRLVREYEIPMPRHMLRMVRATLLYDTVAAQLYPKIDVFEEYEDYQKWVAKRTRKKIQRSAARQLYCGPDDLNYLRAHRMFETTELGFYRLRAFLDQRTPSFESLTDKAWEFVSLLARLFGRLSTITIIAFFIAVVTSLDRFGVEAAWWDAPTIFGSISLWEIPAVLGQTFREARTATEIQTIEVIFSGWIFAMGAAALLYMRRALFRFRDRDIGD